MLEKTQIVLNNVRLYAYHGVLPQERTVGGWYTLTLTIDCPLTPALSSDDLAGTIDYAAVLEVIKGEMAVPSRLLEHVAGRILNALFSAFPKIERAELTLTKDNPPVGTNISGATVRLSAKNDKCFS